MILGAPRTARADLRVERAEGAESCPDAAAFVERMGDGGAPSLTGRGSIEVRFEPTAEGYRARVQMPGGKHRVLADDAPTCDGLAEATALAVKLAFELDEPPAVAPAASPPLRDEDSGAAELVGPRAAGAEISASGVLAVGLASPAAPGLRAGAALLLGRDRWSIGVTGIVLPAQAREVAGGTVRVSVLGGGVEGCRRLPVGDTMLLAVCGRVEAMRLEGSASGFARSEERARPLFAGTLLGRARRTLAGPAALFVEAGGVVPFVRERFALDGVGVVYDPPVVAFTAGIGVLVDFE
jgi:hypothetical protein